MARSRTYEDSCGIARALDVVGERWALLVVRELLHGPKRFTDLQQGLRRISPDVLSQRLRELEGSGIVERTTMPPPAASRVYELTSRGRELEPVLQALGRFGSAEPMPTGAGPLGSDAAVVALETTFDPLAAGALQATFALVLDDESFAVQIDDGALGITRGKVAEPAATLETDTGTLAAVLWHGRLLQDAIAAGDAAVTGNKRAAARFVRLFRTPMT